MGHAVYAARRPVAGRLSLDGEGRRRRRRSAVQDFYDEERVPPPPLPAEAERLVVAEVTGAIG